MPRTLPRALPKELLPWSKHFKTSRALTCELGHNSATKLAQVMTVGLYLFGYFLFSNALVGLLGCPLHVMRSEAALLLSAYFLCLHCALSLHRPANVRVGEHIQGKRSACACHRALIDTQNRREAPCERRTSRKLRGVLMVNGVDR